MSSSLSSHEILLIPGRQKRMGIFPQSKSIQAAKRKLGYGFFDPALLEFSRNSIELSKLVDRWNDIDKEKFKVLQTINHDKFLLLRSLKRNYYTEDSDQFKTDLIASKEGIETVEGRIVPPGFRFTASGDIKKSTLAPPLLNLPSEFADPEEDDLKGFYKVDYDREIEELRELIEDIAFEVSKHTPNVLKTPLTGRHNRFLRAHSNDNVVPAVDTVKDEVQFPNNRIAFEPDTSRSRDLLHKKNPFTPCYRTCSACQFKLKHDNDDLISLQEKHGTKTDLNRKWSYVPHGRYVPSPRSLTSSGTSVQDSSSTLAGASGISLWRRTPRPSNRNILSASDTSWASLSPSDRSSGPGSAEIITSSQPRGKAPSDLLKHTLLAQMAERNAPSSARSARSQASSLMQMDSGLLSDREYSELHMASESGSLGSTRAYVDYEERMGRLKEFQAGEEDFCEKKVKRFLKKCDSVPSCNKL